LVLAGLAGASALSPADAAQAQTQFKPTNPADHWFNVRDFGAVGDGATIDSRAINKAIDQAASQGGGVVHFPPGAYACYTLRLKSNITLHLGEGAVILAAAPTGVAPNGYDDPGAGAGNAFQDYGHSHWANSLIFGEGLHDIAITGTGLIWGKNLTRGHRFPDDAPDVSGPGVGDKAIALKNCRNVLLRDFKILQGGWFALLATGVDNMTIDNLTVDTNRDGLDIDCCRDVTIADCRVNTPNDDAIVLKSSLALGEVRSTERVEITRCHVSGFDLGTMLDETLGRTQQLAPDRDRVTGRIKLGTESNGDFRHIAISDCTLTRSRGLALETVDGGAIEDVSISNIVLREVTTAPLFLRLGDRGRGPDGTTRGAIRRISVRSLTAWDILPDYAATIAGLEGCPIEDVSLTDVRLVYAGDGQTDWAQRRPDDMAQAYPEPSMFGPTPAYGLWARHVTGLTLDNVRIETLKPDPRPPVLLQAVHDARFSQLDLAWAQGAEPIVGEDVSGLVADPPRRVGAATADGAQQ
jgi:polygalacturonase